MRIADTVGLASRPLRAVISGLSQLHMPSILHWQFNHFVVLLGVKGKNYQVFDPARGELLLQESDIRKSFTGVALELRPAEDFKRKEDVRPVRLSDFWSRITGLKRSLVQAFLLAAVLQLFVLTAPLFQQLVVDEAITKQDQNFLVVLAMGFALLAVITQAISFLRSWVMLYFVNELSFQMAINLFRHLLRLPVDFFEKRHVGDISSRSQTH